MSRRVLVVDDEPNVLNFCARALELKGYAVQTASSGKEALALLATEKFDLLATDIRMPEMSGLDLMDRVSAMGLDLPVIVITGMGSLEVSIQALRAGAIDFITKPFGRNDLVDAVARALLQARVARERARLRVLAPVLDLSRRVREGAGLCEVCQSLVKLALGQPGALGAAILLEEPGEDAPLAIAVAGVLEGLTVLETSSLPAARDSLAVWPAGDIPGEDLRQRLFEQGARTIVAAPMETPDRRFGEIWMALEWLPEQFDSHYAEAVAILARHAANLLANVREVSLPEACGF
ncbi:MAG: response regulator [Chloroflexi bacterium]|nr:response regulator [Chloroflexota bacterium]